MPAHVETKDCIYDDITQVIRNIYTQSTGKRPDQNVTKYLRSKSYEILLKKSFYHTYPKTPEINIELLKRCYSMRQDMNTVKQMERADSMQKCTDKIMNEEIFKQENFQSILSFLICLSDNVEYLEPLDLYPWTFGKRDELCLINSKTNVGCKSIYPIYSMQTFLLQDDLEEEYFKDPHRRIQEAEARGQSVNPYLPNFNTMLLELEPGRGLPLLGQFLPPLQPCVAEKNDLNYNCPGQLFTLNDNILTYGMIDNGSCLKPSKSRLNSICGPKVKFETTGEENIVTERFSDRMLVCTSARSLTSDASGHVSIRTITDQEDTIDVWANLNFDDKECNHRNWNYLGNVNPPKEPLFATEADSALFLWSISNPNAEVSILDSEQFLTDIKHMLAGISSKTFVYDENEDTFEICGNVALPHRSPSSVEAFSQKFISAGNWMVRLTKLFSESNQCYGFIYDAFRKLLCEYLFSYRQVIFNMSCTTEIEFHCNTLDLCKQVEQLGKLFCRYSTDFPKGSQLLAILMKEASRVVNRDVELILFSAIRACCTVYFRIIQQWIFTGTLYDPFRELFIVKKNVPPGTRLHWNTAYTIRQDTTPAFLEKLAIDILNCGKNLQLLRDCDPTHPLITKLPEIAPYIPCCLSAKDLKELNNVCSEYNTKANEQCGAMLTIQSYLDEEKLKQIKYIAIAQERRKENYEKWKAADIQKKQIIKDKKDKQMKELQAQIAEIRLMRENERKERIKEEVLLMKKNEIAQEQDRLRVEEEKMKIRAYYAELGRTADQKNMLMQWKNKRRKFEDKRVDFLLKEREETIKFLMSMDKNAPIEDNNTVNESKIVMQSKVENTVLENSENNDDCGNYDDGENSEIIKDKINKVEILTKNIDDNIKKELRLNFGKFEEIYWNVLNIPKSDSETDFSSALTTPASDLNVIEDLNKNVEFEEPVGTVCDILDNRNDNTALTDNFNNLIEDFAAARRNKNKVLGTSESIDNHVFVNTNITDNLSQAQMNKKHVLGTSESIDNHMFVNTNITDNLSQAQINKKHVMGHHYNEPMLDNARVSKTQAQLNKEKYLAEEFGIGENINIKKDLTLHLNADGLKNRERMICSSVDFRNDSPNMGDQQMKTSKSFSHMSVDSTPMTPKDEILDLPEKLMLDTADILEMDEEKTGDVDTAQVDLIDGFKFPTSNDEYQLKEKSVEPEEIWPSDENEVDDPTNPFGMFSTNLTSKQFHLFKWDKEPADDLDSEVIHDLNIGNFTSYLQNSVRIPLYAQCDLVRTAVLDYFLRKLDVLAHFRSLQCYMLLLDGEFGSALCKKLFEIMENGEPPVKTLQPGVLHMILAQALAVSGGASDPNSSRLSFRLRESPPLSWQHSKSDALRCLAPTYNAPWPLSMILPESILDQYALVFQHLVKVRRVAHKLDECFESLNASVRRNGDRLLCSRQFRTVQLWRGVMAHFVRSLQVYQTGSVLHSAAWRFEKLLQGVRGADELYRRHKQYVKYITFLCLQTPSSHKVRKIFDNCFTSIILFNQTLHSGEWTKHPVKNEYRHPRYRALQKVFNNFEDIVAHCFKFCVKLSTCGYQPMLVEFVDILDMNGYYTNLLKKYAQENKSS